MIFKKMRVVWVLWLLLLLAGQAAAGGGQWRVIHGEIRQIYVPGQKLLVESEGQKQILSLKPHCLILRAGCPAAFQSLRPVTAVDFQDGLFWINPAGLVCCLLVNYKVVEEDGKLIAYDIFGKAK